jgi:hypothetical protein
MAFCKSGDPEHEAMINPARNISLAWIRTGALAAMAAAFVLVPGLALADMYVGQSLRDALSELNEQGAAIFFSSEMVTPEMRVVKVPESADPLQVIKQILAPHQLTIVQGPGRSWLVTRAEVTPLQPSSQIVEADTLLADLNPPKIDELTVVANRYRLYGNGSTVEFSHEDIDRLPHLADDLMRAIQRLPVAASNDFSARINLRGGVSDETALYIDGLELIDPFHLKDLQGTFSIVDSNLVDRADVLPGGFPAKFGDYASGIVDIRTLPPPEQSTHAVGVSFVNAFANTRGSFENGRGGWLVSVRRGYLDWIFKLIDTGSGDFTPRYLDVLAKIEHDIGDRHTVSAHLLAAEDDLVFFEDGDNTRVDGDASSLFLWLRAASDWTDQLSSETVLWHNSIKRNRVIEDNDPFALVADLLDFRDIEVLGLRSDWRWRAAPNLAFGFGVELTDSTVDYNYSLIADYNSPLYPAYEPINRRTVTTVNGEGLGIYASVWRKFEKLSAEIGWRWDAERYTGLDEGVSSPRISLAYELSPRTRLLAAWGDFYQFQPIEALQVEDGIDQFAPATRAEHRVLGVEYRIGDSLTLRADAYQKLYRRVRPRYTNLLDGFEPIPEALPDRFRIDAGSARAEGVELTVKKRSAAGLSWWASYTFSKVEDRVSGVDVARAWDQTHALNAVFNWRGERWNFNVASAWHSGWPRTDVTIGVVDTPSGPQPGVVPGPRNAENYDDYFRVDARISRDVNLKRGTFTYFFEVYNLFDTENTCCVDELSFSPTQGLLIDEENWLPRIPSFGFTWTFH